jgi:hypothetical protein
MRNERCGVVLGALLGFGAVAHAAGCDTTWDDYYKPLLDPKTAIFDDGGADGSDGSGGGDSGPPGCSGDPTTDPAIVTEACGVFVSASAPAGGTGTRASPFQTFVEAAEAKPSRIFACAGTYTETVQVSFSGGVEVYGGFTGCTATSWAWSESMQAAITTVAGKPGIVLDGGANKLENVSVTAPSAPATTPGGSSIALLVNGGSLDMTNGALTAGDAQDGAAGASLMPDPTLNGSAGASGDDACSGTTHSPGPMGAANTCANAGSSTAGNGGAGGQIVGSTLQPAGGGTDGSATPSATPVGMNDGEGGVGEGQSGATQCVRGDDGASGTLGSSGAGATGLGTIAAGGYTGVAGQDGTNGTPGQGGGGGGGAQGGLSVICSGTTTGNVPGASGGAGGTGGCGGALGGGGVSGGSSIALLVVDAQVTLVSVTLTAGKGGNGGAGGSGQSGGSGGGGGMNGSGGPVDDACPGGKGGKGGNGGPGGGGQGGHSLGIAFQGATAPAGGTFMIAATNAGSGGMGGNNNTMGTGASGLAENCWDFGKNMACGK